MRSFYTYAWIPEKQIVGVYWDPRPFNGLQGVISLAALYMTVLIAVTQRREDRLAQHRASLTLQREQKTAKILEMLATRGVGA